MVPVLKLPRTPSRLDSLAGMPRRMMSLLRQHGTEPRRSIDGAPCLERLPDELWMLIMDHLEWPGELRSLALVSHAVYRKVLPVLYRTVVVGWSSPERMLAVFNMLSRNECLCACIRTLVFDDDPSRYGRAPRRPEDIRRNFLAEDTDKSRLRADEKEIDRVRTVLYRILPLCCNLQDVLLCRPHPLFLSTGAWIKQQPPPEVSKISKVFGVTVNVRRWVARRRAAGTDEVFHRGSGTDLWAVLFKRRVKDKDCSRVTRLCAPVSVPRVPQQKSAVLSLTHITLHHVRLVPDDAQSIRRWNKVLRCASGLRTLCFVDTQSLPHLLVGCTFPVLEDFEAVGLSMRSATRNRLLSSFFLAHARTLRIIALQLNPARPSSSFWDGEWLRKPDAFVELHTLRVEGMPRNRLHNFYIDGCTFASPSDHTANSAAWASLVGFVQAVPGLLDVALAGINMSDARALRRTLISRPNMLRVLLADELLSSFAEKVLPNSVQAIPWKRAVYRYRYALQYWVFYDVLFEGLELSRSGYRPSTRRE